MIVLLISLSCPSYLVCGVEAMLATTVRSSSSIKQPRKYVVLFFLVLLVIFFLSSNLIRMLCGVLQAALPFIFIFCSNFVITLRVKSAQKIAYHFLHRGYADKVVELEEQLVEEHRALVQVCTISKGHVVYVCLTQYIIYVFLHVFTQMRNQTHIAHTHSLQIHNDIAPCRLSKTC